MPGPLEGIRVVDLTTVLLGPLATQIFGDLGADVIRIESPQVDSLRRVLPARHQNMAGVILNLHRNKRSIVLDLKTPAGKDVLWRLVRSSDVFIHNMRRAAIAGLGIDYDSVRRINPDIVYCGAYGFGRSGPYRDRAAYDDVIQAGSGLSSLVAMARGEPDLVPAAVCDKVTGLTVAWAVLAALLGRERGKGGQEVEVPMFETMASFNLIEQICGFAFDPPLERIGWKRMMSSKRRPYRTADGYACILPYSDGNWRDFFKFIGRPELCDDPRFLDHPSRIDNTDSLYAIVHEASPRFTTAQWMEFCDRHGIPAMPVIELSALWDDPHLAGSGVVGFAEHPIEGRYRTINCPVSFSTTPSTVRRHAPHPGEQTDEILRELGFSEADIDRLVSERAAFRQAPPSPPPQRNDLR